MPANISIYDPTTAQLAGVNANRELAISLPALEARAGFAKILDSNGFPINTTENGALSISQDAISFFEQVDGVALNVNRWQTSVSGMTIAQANGFITLNAASSVTAANHAILRSTKQIPLYGHLPVKVSFQVKTGIQPQSNITMEFGLGSVATNVAPTDGVYFRWNTSGEFRAIINNGGVETSSEALTPPANGDCVLVDIVIVEDLVQFFIDDVLVTEIATPVGVAYPTASGHLPVFLRVYNGAGAPAQAGQLGLGQVVVVQQASDQGKGWPDVLAGVGQASYNSQVTPFLHTANHANSTVPGTGTLSNTAAGYATLGGKFLFAAPAGAETDFALFGFAVPAGLQLYLTDIAISAMNMGAAVATTATILEWALGLNASAVSLATAEAAGTAWAPRVIPLGLQSFAIGAAIGAGTPDIVRQFGTPLVVDGGRFFHVIVRVPVGTATASQLIRGAVVANGYFE